MKAVSIIAKQAQAALAKQQPYAETIVCLKDLLTNADLLSDSLIRRGLRKIAGYQYLSEEYGNQYVSDMWIVDPLDGTANYLAQGDCWAVSIAWTKGFQVIGGVICTGSGNVYTTPDSHYLSVSRNDQLATSRIGTDWTKRESDYDVVQILQMLRQRTLYPKISGCCSYSLAQVARGGLDGFVHLSPELFDFAAGAAIVEKAGGKVTDTSGHPWDIYSKSIVATNGLIHSELLKWLGTVLFPADYMRREDAKD